jgi:hypothetical protein
MKALVVCVVGLAGCNSPNPVANPGVDAGPGGADAAGAPAPDGAIAPAPDLGGPPAIVDQDHDGLDDAQELAWARDYLPYISHSPTEGCALGGLLVRVSPHPQNAKLLHIIYDFLYDNDCGTAIGGIGGHPGDDEVFATTVDPSRPGPDGIVAMKAISHQGTICERTSECGRCPGQKACATLDRSGQAWPAVWPSKDKHGSYVNRADSCGVFNTCGDVCEDNPTPTVPDVVNAGEPMSAMVHDLTTNGFITTANGWTNMQLFHYDPWSGKDFGNAGVVSADLVDPAFDTPACP